MQTVVGAPSAVAGVAAAADVDVVAEEEKADPLTKAAIFFQLRTTYSCYSSSKKKVRVVRVVAVTVPDERLPRLLYEACRLMMMMVMRTTVESSNYSINQSIE